MKEAMRLRICHYIVRATHGDGRGGVFGNPPFNRHSFAALVSGWSARDCQWQSAALCGEMPCLLSRLLAATSLRSCARLRLRGFPPKASLYYGAFGVPCNTTATHPAAPLGSGGAAHITLYSSLFSHHPFLHIYISPRLNSRAAPLGQMSFATRRRLEVGLMERGARREGSKRV